MKKRDDYPVLPHISYGMITDRNGFYVSIPFKGISLNDYRQMHFGKISRIKGQYKSMLDVMCAECIDHKYIKFDNFDGDGLRISKNLFNTQVDIEWVLNFSTVNNRDTANYTQKVLLDAIVKTAILPDDREKFVRSDKTFFGAGKYDMITCIIQSNDMDKTMIKGGRHVTYADIMERLEVSTERKVIDGKN